MIRLRLKRRRTLAAPAYTLTEMLVVLVIIGLLAAVVGPRLFSRLDDAKRRTAHLQLQSLDTAIDLFRLDVGRLPTQDEGLQVLVSAPADGGDAWLGPYLAKAALPRDPWGHAYIYQIDGATEHYRLLSYGADGREGGSGAAADLVVEGSNGESATSSPASPRIDGDGALTPAPDN
ncbi:MAG: type II secretion system major pseudopilin GspG [Pseudomonadota bacterium]